MPALLVERDEGVRFREDASVLRDKNGQRNLSLLRKLVINTFKTKSITNFRRHMFKILCDPSALRRELAALLKKDAHV